MWHNEPGCTSNKLTQVAHRVLHAGSFRNKCSSPHPRVARTSQGIVGILRENTEGSELTAQSSRHIYALTEQLPSVAHSDCPRAHFTSCFGAKGLDKTPDSKKKLNYAYMTEANKRLPKTPSLRVEQGTQGHNSHSYLFW